MPDVVLVFPKNGFDEPGINVTLPLSILAVASGLVPEFNVKVIDQRIEPDWEEKLRRVARERPVCVGISSMTGTQIYFGLLASKIVKETAPEVPVVWGGMHATTLPEETVSHPLVDYVVKGEGEYAFRDLVRALAYRKPLSEVPSLYWKENREIKSTPQMDPLDLNTLPDWPFEILDVEAYIAPSQYLYPGVTRLLPFEGSRGCPFKCTFCSEPALTRKYRTMDPKIFARRTLEMKERFKLDHVLFYDDEFLVNVRWAAKVADEVGGAYSWWCQSRANDLLRSDVKRLQKNGLLVVAPGLESGSNRMLKFIRKQETREEYIESNRRLAETGVYTQYNFIVGYPGETPADVGDTVDLVLQLIDENPRVLINSFSLLTPLPATEMLEVCARDFGYTRPQGLENWMSVARRRFPCPWQRENEDLYAHLMYTSLFITTARQFTQTGNYRYIPPFLFDWYAASVKRRWRKRRFTNSLDVKLLRLVHKMFAPIDFGEIPRIAADAPAAATAVSA